jgi:hypothetical protein
MTGVTVTVTNLADLWPAYHAMADAMGAGRWDCVRQTYDAGNNIVAVEHVRLGLRVALA